MATHSSTLAWHVFPFSKLLQQSGISLNTLSADYVWLVKDTKP